MALIMSVGLTSCSLAGDPEAWSAEIEDSFRAQLAFAYAYVDYDDSVLDALADRVEIAADKEEEDGGALEDCIKYKWALEKIAPQNPIAAEILKKYNAIDVEFTKFKRQPDEGNYYVWTSKEINTGIKVTYKYASSIDIDWSLELDEDDLTNHMIDKFEAEHGGNF